MSPVRGRLSASACRFPRVSGDEPLLLACQAEILAFSPRERG